MSKEKTLEFPPTDDEYRRTAESQKRQAVAVAGKLLRGESLTDMESMFAAGILESWAANKTMDRPKPPGKQPEFNASDAAIEVYGLVHSGKASSITKAIEMVSEQYDVTNQAMTKAVKRKMAAAKAYWDRVPATK